MFRDIKAFNYSSFAASHKETIINHCSFYNNYSVGSIIAVSSFGNGIKSKLRFTNSEIYNNYGGQVMSSLFTDSSIVQGNQFYNNHTTNNLFARSSYGDTSTHVFIFDNNELHNNHISGETALCSSHSGGFDFITNNKVTTIRPPCEEHYQ